MHICNYNFLYEYDGSFFLFHIAHKKYLYFFIINIFFFLLLLLSNINNTILLYYIISLYDWKS